MSERIRDCERFQARLNIAYSEPAAMLRQLREELRALYMVQTAPYLDSHTRAVLCGPAVEDAFNCYANETINRAVDLMVDKGNAAIKEQEDDQARMRKALRNVEKEESK